MASVLTKAVLLPICHIWSAIASLGVFICGFITAISVQWYCILVGVYTIFVGILCLIMEIPFFFKFHRIFEKINELTSKFKDWHKLLVYFLLIIPMFFCLGTAEIFAILFTVTIGLAYFLLWFFDVNKEDDGIRVDSVIQSAMNMSGKV